MDYIKVGDVVQYRGFFGMDPPAPARVEHMEWTEKPRQKYGEPCDEVHISMVKANRVVFTLSTGNWCYSEQIDIPTG